MIHAYYFVLFLCLSSVLGRNILQLRKTVGHEPRIINGEDAKPGEFPWQVYLVNIISDAEIYGCNGAIIGEHWILTSASCINRGLMIEYRAGEVVQYSPDATWGITLDYTVHEEYEPNTLQNDIGLVYLFTPLTFNENVSAVALSDDELKAGVSGTITGWGTADDGSTIILQYVNVTTIDNSDCQIFYGTDVVGPGTVCATSDFGSPCYGDAGSPLVVDDDGDAALAAIFSFYALDNCEQYPGGYTRISHYRDWIREKTGI